MHCLLIDDDIPTLEALQYIVNWSELGIQKINTVTNIHDAKQLLNNQHVDIMICDIEMPRGSGLDLLKWTYEKKLNSRFIFLTCHDSFEFASEAIQYNVDAYILKPINPSKLIAAVAKSTEQLRNKLETTKLQQLSEHWIKNVKVVERSFWRDVLMGNIFPNYKLISAEAKKRSISLQPSDYLYHACLLCIDTTKLKVEWDDGLFLAALTNVTEEVFLSQRQSSQLLAYKQDEMCYFCYLLPTDYSIKQQQKIGNLLIDACQRYLNIEATVYVSEAVKVDELFNKRLELEQRDKENMVSFGRVHFAEQFSSSFHDYQYNFDYEGYLTLFHAKDKVRIANKIKHDLEESVAKGKLDLDSLISIREDFLQVCYSYLSSHDIQAHRIFTDHSSKLLYSRAERSVYDFMKWAFYISDKTIELVKELKQAAGILDTALQYIHTHYKTHLSREDIAASVFLNPDYFSKLFKQKMGKSLSEYINDYRIKLAKQILLETDWSISQIALETGFENLSYFSTIFKKYTGITPNHYRASNK